jgi:hypothetical protein
LKPKPNGAPDRMARFASILARTASDPNGGDSLKWQT